MCPQKSTNNEHPLLHIYPLPGHCQSLQIKGNTAGLRSLLDALIDALGQGSGVTDLMCGVNEPFEVQVRRIDADEEWQEQPGEQLEPEELEIDDPVADLFKHYSGELPDTIYQAAKSWTPPES